LVYERPCQVYHRLRKILSKKHLLTRQDIKGLICLTFGGTNLYVSEQ